MMRTEQDCLDAWRACIAATDAIHEAMEAEGRIAAHLLLEDMSNARQAERLAGRAYLASADRRTDEPHTAHSGAPMTSRQPCGCVRVRCDVCMEVLRESYCTLHHRAYLAVS